MPDGLLDLLWDPEQAIADTRRRAEVFKLTYPEGRPTGALHCHVSRDLDPGACFVCNTEMLLFGQVFVEVPAQ